MYHLQCCVSQPSSHSIFKDPQGQVRGPGLSAQVFDSKSHLLPHPLCSPLLRPLFWVTLPARVQERSSHKPLQVTHPFMYSSLHSFIHSASPEPSRPGPGYRKEGMHTWPLGDLVSHTNSVCPSTAAPITLGMIIRPPDPLGAGRGCGSRSFSTQPFSFPGSMCSQEPP